MSFFTVNHLKDSYLNLLFLLIFTIFSGIAMATAAAIFSDNYAYIPPLHEDIWDMEATDHKIHLTNHSEFVSPESGIRSETMSDNPIFCYFDLTLKMIYMTTGWLGLYNRQKKFDFNLVNCCIFLIALSAACITIEITMKSLTGYHIFHPIPILIYSIPSGLIFVTYMIIDLNLMTIRCDVNGLRTDSTLLALLYLHTDFLNPKGNIWSQICGPITGRPSRPSFTVSPPSG